MAHTYICIAHTDTHNTRVYICMHIYHNVLLSNLIDILALRRAPDRIILRIATAQHAQKAAHSEDGATMPMEYTLV